jgi:GT2 family glycosyltransferase
MLPDVPRVAEALTGFNVSYKRAVLEKVKDRYQKGFYETFIHQELRRLGYELFLMPSAIVYHNKTYALRASIVETYHHGRLFAALRTSVAPWRERIFRVATSFILPVLLPMRIALRTIRKNKHVKELIAAFPYLLLLMSAWSYGEFCGYLCREGSSARRWK